MDNLLLPPELAESVAYRADPYHTALRELRSSYETGKHIGYVILRPSEVHQIITDLQEIADTEELKLLGLI